MVLGGDPATVGERLAAVLLHVLEQPELHQRFAGFVRAAASAPDAAQVLREFLGRELFAPVAELLGVDDPTLRLNLVGSQIVGLVMARYVVGIEPLASLPSPIVATAIAPTLQHYLSAALASAHASP